MFRSCHVERSPNDPASRESEGESKHPENSTFFCAVSGSSTETLAFLCSQTAEEIRHRENSLKRHAPFTHSLDASTCTCPGFARIRAALSMTGLDILFKPRHTGYFCVMVSLWYPTVAVSIRSEKRKVESSPMFGYLGVMYLLTKYSSAMRGTVKPSMLTSRTLTLPWPPLPEASPSTRTSCCPLNTDSMGLDDF